MRRPLLESPRLSASGAVVGRPRKPPPANAAALIQELAADGWSKIGIGWKLGATAELLERWMSEVPGLQEAFDVGRERERQVLHNVLYRIAVEGDSDRDRILAAQTLLNSRHGYRTDEPERGNRINIFNLPGPMSREDFLKTVVGDG